MTSPDLETFNGEKIALSLLGGSKSIYWCRGPEWNSLGLEERTDNVLVVNLKNHESLKISSSFLSRNGRNEKKVL